MSRIVAFEHLTLDGVMQAPGRADEDPRDGFQHGGWGAAYGDPVLMQAVSESMGKTGALLLGRRTYQDFYKVWPSRKESPFSAVLDNSIKYVASRSLREPLPWMNSRLLAGDAEGHVARLREQPGKDIVILGSGMLVQSLLHCNLIDELLLTVNPLLLGGGKRLFPVDGSVRNLRLVDSRTTSKGVIVATYQPAAA